MKNTIHFDMDLQVESYRLCGMIPRFTNHFHYEYVIGFLEQGLRKLYCNHQDFIIYPGDMVIFNPHDNHACQQVGDYLMDWHCLNIKPEIMQQMAYEITGEQYLPYFKQTVLEQSELTFYLRDLCHMIEQEVKDFQKEEIFFFFIESLIKEYGGEDKREVKEIRSEIQMACDFLEENYDRNISLDELSKLTCLSKYYFLRSFTKEKGISPYRYLENIRLDKAKKMLEKGELASKAAMEIGFSDQSHFTNFFKNLMGLTPMQYRGIFHNMKDVTELQNGNFHKKESKEVRTNDKKD